MRPISIAANYVYAGCRIIAQRYYSVMTDQQLGCFVLVPRGALLMQLDQYVAARGTALTYGEHVQWRYIADL